MTTTVYINSLVRYDDQICEQLEPNPFEFTVPSRVTSKWRWKRHPHSLKAHRGRGGYEVTLDALMIPKSLMPDPEPLIMFEVNGSSNIDIGNMTRVKCNNQLCQEIIDGSNCGCVGSIGFAVDCRGCTGTVVNQTCAGISGCTGVSGAPTFTRCKNSSKSNLNNTWVAHFDCDSLSTNMGFYVYKSDSVVSVKYEAWHGCKLNVRVLDSCGNVIEPPFDLTQICGYAPLFCKENQVLAVFNYRFVSEESLIGPACFSDNK